MSTAAFLTVAVSLVVAEVPSASDLAAKTEQNYRGFGQQRVEASLTVRDPSGTSKVYRMTQYWREMDDGVAFLVRFESPENFAGTALLAREQPKGPDRIWLYLSQTKELRQITGRDRSARFLDSEFSFEDLSFMRSKDYVVKVLGEGEVGGRPCWRVDMLPKTRRARSSKTSTCIDKERHLPIEMKLFDHAGALLKIVKTSEFVQQQGRWRPKRLFVRNVQNGRTSALQFEEYDLSVKLSKKLFTLSQLRKR